MSQGRQFKQTTLGFPQLERKSSTGLSKKRRRSEEECGEKSDKDMDNFNHMWGESERRERKLLKQHSLPVDREEFEQAGGYGEHSLTTARKASLVAQGYLESSSSPLSPTEDELFPSLGAESRHEANEAGTSEPREQDNIDPEFEDLSDDGGLSKVTEADRHKKKYSKVVSIDDPELDDLGDDGGLSKVTEADQHKKKYSKGVSIDELRRAPDCHTANPLQELRPSKDCKVMFELPTPQGSPPHPHPIFYKEDMYIDRPEKQQDFVFMPCSPSNIIPHIRDPNKTMLRWQVIEKSLGNKKEISGSFELQEAILSYNFHYRRKWNFENLHLYFKENPEANQRFFQQTLPEIQKLACLLPHLCTKPLPLLKPGVKMKLVLSQQQAACLLANAFFCTFPGRNTRHKFKDRSGVKPLPDINFSNIFNGPYCHRKQQKLKCIIHYFERVTQNMPTGVLSFSRQVLHNNNWQTDAADFTEIHVSSSGTIEDDGIGMLQADFANKVVGGGVLGRGCVQEEIRFLICPEMIISRLFTETLEDNEVLIMKGCERFSNYTGYGDTFQWDSDHVDTTPRDPWGRLWTEVVAMDALNVSRRKINQFEKRTVERELNKAYCAFMDGEYRENLPAICTGNWGCGAFGGHTQLKALIQMIAASHAKREVCYFTFGDNDLVDEMGHLYEQLNEFCLTTKDVLGFIQEYYIKESGSSKTPLFDFILRSNGLPSFN